MIALLLAATAARIGFREALGGLSDLAATARLVAVYQVAMPLGLLGAALALGAGQNAVVFALLAMLAAPSVTGAPNFAIMLGHDPAPAMRLLVLGTALFPLTVLPVLWMAPGFGSAGRVLAAGGGLAAMIALAVAAGFALRAGPLSGLDEAGRRTLDGVAALLLAVVVVALMSAIGPALRAAPGRLALWLALATAVNLGLQWAAFRLLGPGPASPARAIVAGNRNLALTFLALPESATGPLMIFLGCYQVPMYLTPLVMAPLYARAAQRRKPMA